MKKKIAAVALAAAAAVIPLSSCGLWGEFSDWQKANCIHKWEHEITEPTCTESGQERDICRKCYEVRDVKVLAVKQHDYQLIYADPSSCATYRVRMKCGGCSDVLDETFSDTAFKEISHVWDYNNAVYETDEHGCNFVTLNCKECEGVSRTFHMWDEDAVSWYRSKQVSDGNRMSARYSKDCGDCGQKIELFYFWYTPYSLVLREPETENDTALVGFLSNYSYKREVFSSVYNRAGVTLELSYSDYMKYLSGEYEPPRTPHEFILQ